VNTRLFELVNQFARSTAWLHPLAAGYARFGVVLFAGLLLAGWWIARRGGTAATMAVALWAPAATLLAVAVNQPIVDAVRGARPYTVLPHALVLLDRTTDYSFPSDHATMAGAVAGVLLLVHRRLGMTAVAAALLMAAARVYCGVHWPADVLAGLVFGAAVGLGTGLAARAVGPRVVVRLYHTRLRPLLTTPSGAAGCSPGPGGTPRDRSRGRAIRASPRDRGAPDR